jgi:CelD/BcsL family acetyltransferase involved in cellulose biosynthesis
MKWSLRPAAAFSEIRELWDDLNARQGAHPLLDSGFVGPLVKHFASPATRLAVADGSGAPGAVLLDPAGKGMWRTFQPSQAPLGLILLGDRRRGFEQIRDILASLPGYALGLSVMQQDPDFTSLPRTDAGAVEALDYIETARLVPSGSFEDYWKSRGRNLVHNLSRQRRRLADQGVSLELVAERDPSAVADGVRQYGEIESRSWKAEEGTAVSPDDAQGRFYREMLEHFCTRGEGVIYSLSLNGQIVAVDLCLERHGMLVILKTTYDEGIEKLSLGLLLHQEIFKAAFSEQRVKVIEFYGRVRDWHTKWTDETRTMYHTTLYRHPMIRAARRRVAAWRRGGS